VKKKKEEKNCFTHIIKYTINFVGEEVMINREIRIKPESEISSMGIFLNKQKLFSYKSHIFYPGRNNQITQVSPDQTWMHKY
jgi:hypothetical protein